MIRFILCFCIFVSIRGKSDQSVLVPTTAFESTVFELKQQMIEMQRHIEGLENGLMKQTSLNNKLLDQVTDLRKENAQTKMQLSALQMGLSASADPVFVSIRGKSDQGVLVPTTAFESTVFELKQQMIEMQRHIEGLENGLMKQTSLNNKLLDQVTDLRKENAETKKQLSAVKMELDSVTGGELKQFSRLQDRHIPRRRDLNLVAFSVYPTSDITGLTAGQILKYDGVIVNEGNAYDVTTGIFTAPLSGLYLFSFFIEDFQQQTLWVDLKKDGKDWSRAMAEPVNDGHNSMGGNTILLHVNKGSSVWLEVFIGQRIQSYSPTFSGVLLY